mmetsp:Transcript_34654/g.81041  ORF Transcript_34654/g.81041 Transcript_34654/m.81041 type:complete len:228 (+) Transcript_34654:3-686(+)
MSLPRSAVARRLVPQLLMTPKFPSHQFSHSEKLVVAPTSLSEPRYWDEFYSKSRNQSFEWFHTAHDLHHLRSFLSSHLAPYQQENVLHLGCGTSNLWLGLEEFTVINVDFSPQVVTLMAQRFPHATFLQCDARNTSFSDSYFGAAFEKGTLDALLRGPRGEESAAQLSAEVGRILRPGGVWLQITDEDPDLRLPLLRKMPAWETVNFRSLAVGDGEELFLYSCHKAT